MSEKLYTTTSLSKLISQIPRKQCGVFPTPLQHEPRLAKLLGIASLHIKREDLAGLAFGGNYARFWEFVIYDAVNTGADCIVHGAAEHSNQLTLLSAAARKYGLDCYIIARSAPRTDPRVGNMLLQRLYGSYPIIVEAELGPEMDAAKQKVAQNLWNTGRHPYVVERNRIGALSTLGATQSLCEIFEALRDSEKQEPDYIYVSSCGANHAGLLLGLRLLRKIHTHVISNAPVNWPTEEIVLRQIRGASDLLGVAVSVSEKDVINYKEFLSEEGFGEPTRDALITMVRWAYHGGPILDPIYTAPTIVSIIRDIKIGKLKKEDHVVFVHTGGTPLALFYHKELDAVLTEFETGQLSYDFFA